MANHKSAKKRIKQTNSRAEINNVRKSKVKTAVKKFTNAIEAKDKDLATKTFRDAEKELRRGVAKGIFKKTTISRRISRLARICKKAFSA